MYVDEFYIYFSIDLQDLTYFFLCERLLIPPHSPDVAGRGHLKTLMEPGFRLHVFFPLN